jgi:single-strand DNA-binding protein
MARGINKVILVGNLGNDRKPSTRKAHGRHLDQPATTSVRKDKDGNTQERTEWHRVKFFGKLGEIAGEYLRKGSSVLCRGLDPLRQVHRPGRRREVFHRHRGR